MNDPLELQVDGWMKQFAAIDDRERRLPDPSVIWLKAQVLQSRKEIARAAMPITTMQIAAYAAVAACWAALLTWKWALIQAWLDSLRPASIVLGARGISLSSSFVITFLALASVTVMLAMHTIFLEE